MLWLKAFHLIFMVTWFAGLFYLPRLFVYHCELTDPSSEHYQRFCRMERKLFWIIMTPGAILTLALGLGLLHTLGLPYLISAHWLHAKLTCVLLLIGYHILLYVNLRAFAQARVKHTATYYRLINEVPTVLLIVIVLLAVIKPAFL